MKWELLLLSILSLILSNGLGPLDDPYKILGATKSFTAQELRKAYKKLAKEWYYHYL